MGPVTWQSPDVGASTTPETPARPAGEEPESAGAAVGTRLRRAIDRLAFPDAVVVPARREPLVVGAAAVGATVVQLYASGALPRPYERIWAEDGPVFLTAAETRPLSSAILEPYAGYIHVVPRLLAEVVTWFPAPWWALLVAVLACAVRTAIACLTYYATAGHIPGRAARGALAVVVVTLPLASVEMLGNLANLHWYLTYGAVVAAFWSPTTRGGRVAQTSTIAAAALSNPLALGVAPVVLVRWVVRRSLAEGVLLASTVVAGAVQLFAVAGAEREAMGILTDPAFVSVYGSRVAFGSVTGWSLAETAYTLRGAVKLIWVLEVVVLLTGIVTRRSWAFTLGCVVASVGLYRALMDYLPSGGSLLPGSTLDVGYSARYSAVPALLLLTALCSAAAGRRRRAPSWEARPARGAAVVLAACYLVGVVVGVRPVVQHVAPAWPVAVAAAERQCSEGATSGVARIAPFPPWGMSIPCSTLDPAGRTTDERAPASRRPSR